jgi:hypothetical protein
LPVNAYAPSCRGAKDINALIAEVMSAPVTGAKERSA